MSNDEIKFFRRHFLGPDPFLEPRTYRRDDDDGDHLFAGEVNNLPSTVGGGGFHADGKLPRFRAVDFKARSELGPIEGSDIVDWPSTTTRWSRTTRRPRTLVGVAGLAGANPFAEWRSGEYPMPPGADMFGAVLTTEAAQRLGYNPYPAPTGVNSVPVRRPARVQQLRVLRLLRLPDRRQGRSGRAAAQRVANRSLRDPAASRTSSGCCSTPTAAPRAACATSTPTATRTR